VVERLGVRLGDEPGSDDADADVTHRLTLPDAAAYDGRR
jgi:hypothetical protein